MRLTAPAPAALVLLAGAGPATAAETREAAASAPAPGWCALPLAGTGTGPCPAPPRVSEAPPGPPYCVAPAGLRVLPGGEPCGSPAVPGRPPRLRPGTSCIVPVVYRGELPLGPCRPGAVLPPPRSMIR